jgi:hypothetical protein
MWWTPVYVKKGYIFECAQIHQHVKSFLYLCTLLIVPSVLDFQSLHLQIFYGSGCAGSDPSALLFPGANNAAKTFLSIGFALPNR